MEINNKKTIGIGVGVLAILIGYFYFKNKKLKTDVSGTATSDSSTGSGGGGGGYIMGGLPPFIQSLLPNSETVTPTATTPGIVVGTSIITPNPMADATINKDTPTIVADKPINNPTNQDTPTIVADKPIDNPTNQDTPRIASGVTRATLAEAKPLSDRIKTDMYNIARYKKASSKANAQRDIDAVTLQLKGMGYLVLQNGDIQPI